MVYANVAIIIDKIHCRLLQWILSIIDAAFNTYDVSLDVANCGALDGMYAGLGTSQDDVVMDDTFVFAVFTSQTAIVGVAEK